MITQRLSGDNFPSEGNSKFSGEVGGSSTLRYIGTSQGRCQGFKRLSADSGAPERLSIQLKAFSDQGYSFFQQTLIKEYPSPKIFCLADLKGQDD